MTGSDLEATGCWDDLKKKARPYRRLNITKARPSRRTRFAPPWPTARSSSPLRTCTAGWRTKARNSAWPPYTASSTPWPMPVPPTRSAWTASSCSAYAATTDITTTWCAGGAAKPWKSNHHPKHGYVASVQNMVLPSNGIRWKYSDSAPTARIRCVSNSSNRSENVLEWRNHTK